MGGGSSTESHANVRVQPSGRNQVVPVMETTQASQPLEDAARLRHQLKQEKDEHARELAAAAASERQRLDADAVTQRKRLNEEAALERKRLDEEAAEARKHLDEEAVAERKRLHEEDVAARQQADEDATSVRKQLDEDAAIVRKQLDEDAATVRRQLDEDAATVRKQLDEDAAMERKRLDQEAATLRQKLHDEAAAQQKHLDEDAVAQRVRMDEEAAAARKRLDEAAAAERQRLDGIVAALQQQLQGLLAGLAAAGPVTVNTAAGVPHSASVAMIEPSLTTRSTVAPSAVLNVEAAVPPPLPSAVSITTTSASQPLPPPQAPAPPQALSPQEVAAAAARRKAEEEEEGTWKPDDLLTRMPAAGITVDQLPASILDLHLGMPANLRAAPMRLLRIQAVLAWPSIRVYEEVDVAQEAIEVPYGDVDSATWDTTLILSWRWSAPKPKEYIPGFTPMSALQFSELCTVMRRALADGMRYIWIDWSCVSQYSAPSMVEVLRSKVFYVRARAMTIIPSFVPLPSDGVVRLLLVKATRVLKARADATGSPRCRIVLGVMESMQAKELVAGREYFTRVWTLAERMARFGRPEQLCNWLSIESWLGMLVDAMLRSTEDRSASAMYKRILGREAGAALDGVLGPLEAAVKTGSMHVSEGLDERVAELFEMAVGVWHTNKELAEAPTRDWLATYLLDAHSGMYAAWSDADRIWSIYSYFCWKQLDQGSQAALLEALNDLVRVGGGSRRLLMAMATKLGLAKMLPPADADKKLITAAEANDSKTILEALEAGASPDYTGTDGGCALYFASSHGNLEAVKILLQCGATVDAVNVNTATALHIAAANGHAQVVEALLAAGANIHAKRQGGRTPLHLAANEGAEATVQVLVRAGADVNLQDEDGRTPLHLLGLRHEKPEVMRLMLDAGAHKDIRDKHGYNLLHIAAFNERPDTVQLLLHAGVNPNVIAAEKEKALTPLHLAAEHGQKAVIQRLTAGGAKLEANGSLGTPMHRAAVFNKPEAIKALKAAGALLDSREPTEKRTPLMSAAQHESIAALKELLDLGARTGLSDKDGWQPIHYAAKADSYECCKLLKAAGAATDNKSNAGNYPKDLAKSGRVQNLLPDGRGLVESVGGSLFKAFF